MKLLDFIDQKAILSDLQVGSKDEAIRSMVAALRESGSLAEDQEESVVSAILKREELGSTGIGKGVAVPHTKHPSVGDLIGAVALVREGVDFSSLDGEPVYVLFLLVSPPERPGDHLRALETISRNLRDEDFRNFLKQAKTEDDIVELLKEADKE